MYPTSDDTLPRFLTSRVSETSAECLRDAVCLSAAHLRINRLLTSHSQHSGRFRCIDPASEQERPLPSPPRPKVCRPLQSGTLQCWSGERRRSLERRWPNDWCCYDVLDDAARLAHGGCST